jgi:hypothetical protein
MFGEGLDIFGRLGHVCIYIGKGGWVWKGWMSLNVFEEFEYV